MSSFRASVSRSGENSMGLNLEASLLFEDLGSPACLLTLLDNQHTLIHRQSSTIYLSHGHLAQCLKEKNITINHHSGSNETDNVSHKLLDEERGLLVTIHLFDYVMVITAAPGQLGASFRPYWFTDIAYHHRDFVSINQRFDNVDLEEIVRSAFESLDERQRFSAAGNDINMTNNDISEKKVDLVAFIDLAKIQPVFYSASRAGSNENVHEGNNIGQDGTDDEGDENVNEEENTPKEKGPGSRKTKDKEIEKAIAKENRDFAVMLTYISEEPNFLSMDDLQDPFLLVIDQVQLWFEKEKVQEAVTFFGFTQEACTWREYDNNGGKPAVTSSNNKGTINFSQNGDKRGAKNHMSPVNINERSHGSIARTRTNGPGIGMKSPGSVKPNNRTVSKKQSEFDANGVMEPQAAQYGVVFRCRPVGLSFMKGDSSGMIEVEFVERHSMAAISGISSGDLVINANGLKVTDKTQPDQVIKRLTSPIKRDIVNDLNNTAKRMILPGEDPLGDLDLAEFDADMKAFMVLGRRNFETNSKLNRKVNAPMFALPNMILKVEFVRRSDRESVRSKNEASELDSPFILIRSSIDDRKKHRLRGKIIRNPVAAPIAPLKPNPFLRTPEEEHRAVSKLFDELTKNDSLLDKEERIIMFNLREIYDTEVKYVLELKFLLDTKQRLKKLEKPVICKNLKSGRPICEHKRIRLVCNRESSIKVPAIPEKEVDDVFLNIQSVLNLNSKICSDLQKKLSDLQEERQDHPETIGVAEIVEVFVGVFAPVTPFFSMYTYYIQRYSSSTTKQKYLRAHNPIFDDALTTLESTSGNSFPVLLSKPLIRLTKYPLLFKSLKDYTRKHVSNIVGEKITNYEDIPEKLAEAVIAKKVEENRADKMTKMVLAIDQAEKLLTQTVSKVNNKVGEVESVEKMLAIHDEVGGYAKAPNLVQSYRRFVKRFDDCALYEAGDGRDRTINATIIFFNDIILIAQKKYPGIGSIGMSTGNIMTNQVSGKVSGKASGNVGDRKKTISEEIGRELAAMQATKSKAARVSSAVHTASGLFRMGAPANLQAKSNRSKIAPPREGSIHGGGSRRFTDLKALRTLGSLRVTSKKSKQRVRGASSSASSTDSVETTDSTMQDRRKSILSIFNRNSVARKVVGPRPELIKLIPVIELKILDLTQVQLRTEKKEASTFYGVEYETSGIDVELEYERILHTFWFASVKDRDAFVQEFAKLHVEVTENKKGFETAVNKVGAAAQAAKKMI